MGIRSNIGNITTNAMQTLAISGTTASRVFRDRADSALNNLSKEEQSKYHQMKADKMRKEMTDFYSQDEKAKKDAVLGKEDNVDDIMPEESVINTIDLAPETQEGKEVNINIDRQIKAVEGRLMDLKIKKEISEGERWY